MPGARRTCAMRRDLSKAQMGPTFYIKLLRSGRPKMLWAEAGQVSGAPVRRSAVRADQVGAGGDQGHARERRADLAAAAAPQGCLYWRQRMRLGQPGRVLRIDWDTTAGTQDHQVISGLGFVNPREGNV